MFFLQYTDRFLSKRKVWGFSLLFLYNNLRYLLHVLRSSYRPCLSRSLSHSVTLSRFIPILMGIVHLPLNIINVFHVVLTKCIIINFYVQEPFKTKFEHKHQSEMLCLYSSPSNHITQGHKGPPTRSRKSPWQTQGI